MPEAVISGRGFGPSFWFGIDPLPRRDSRVSGRWLLRCFAAPGGCESGYLGGNGIPSADLRQVARDVGPTVGSGKRRADAGGPDDEGRSAQHVNFDQPRRQAEEVLGPADDRLDRKE